MTKVQTHDTSVHGEADCELEEHIGAVLMALTDAGLGLRCPIVHRALLAIADAGGRVHGHVAPENPEADVQVVLEMAEQAKARVARRHAGKVH